MAPRFLRNLAEGRWLRGAGTGVAKGSPVSRLLLLLACSTSLMGCILRDFDYQAPVNVPPAVLGTAETPMSQMIKVDLDAPVGGDAGVGSTLTFRAVVRDPNVDQQLRGLIYLDRNPNAPGRQGLVNDTLITPQHGDQPWDRNVSFDVPLEQLSALGAGCHWAELLVTSNDNISGVADPQLIDPTDQGVGVWWIEVINQSMPSVDMDSCPRTSSGTAP